VVDSSDSFGYEDIKKLVPEQIVKVKSQITSHEKDLRGLEEIKAELESDMFAGNPDENNSMVALFRQEMKGEFDRLDTEIVSIINAKDVLQKSLDLL
jgi:restriction endonuclease S subunit